jgi:hypothetical protein
MSWATRPTTVVVYDNTYYQHEGVYYKEAIQEDETTYVIVSAPVGLQVDTLPEGAETIQVDDRTYYYANGAFYEKRQSDGQDVYVVVEAPAGVEVSSIPADVEEHDEGDEKVYQYDETFFTDSEENSGKYNVEPKPAEEELDEMPSDAVKFKVDEVTYYYTDNATYMEGEDEGYVMSEPPLGGISAELPEGATVIQEGGETYFQLDAVFFKQVSDGYEIVAAPDGSEVVEEEE